MKRLLTYLFLCALMVMEAQDPIMDSLKTALKNARHDTTRCNTLNAMIEAESDDIIWPGYNEQLLKLTEGKLKTTSPANVEYKIYQKHLAAAINNVGYLCRLRGDLPGALVNFEKCLALQEEAGDKKGIANTLNNIAALCLAQGDFAKALEWWEKGIKIQERIGDKKGMAFSLHNMAGVYRHKGDIPKTLEYLSKSLKIREEIGDNKQIAESYTNIGWVHLKQGNIPKALEFYNRSLKIQEAAGNKEGVATTLNNLASAFADQGDMQKSLEYALRGLTISQEIGDKSMVANSLNAIGVYYNYQGSLEKTSPERRDSLYRRSLEYFTRSLKMHEEAGEKSLIGSILNNTGSLYKAMGNIAEALEIFKRALSISEEIGDKNGRVVSLQYIGEIYLLQKDYTKALAYCNKALELSKELGFPEEIRNAAKSLSVAYQNTGNHKLALENYELYIQMRDSVSNQENKKASLKSQLKYEYEKKAAADSVKVAEEKKVVAAQLQQEKTQRFALYGGLGLVGIFALFMVNRFRITNKQKKLIEEQKKVVEQQKDIVDQKQKEILDSIRYAKRIQSALMPNEKYIERVLRLRR